MSKYNDLYAAYEYAYAAVILELTHRLSIIQGQKDNIFYHSNQLATPESKNVVAPNIDNIYSVVWLDLTKGAYELHKPQLDRYLSVALLDAYTNCETLVGTGADGNDEQDYLIAGPDFKGEVPAGYKLLQLPTNTVWGIVRTIIYDNADLANVLELQKKLTLKPFAGTQPVADKDYGKELYKPIVKISSLSLKEFFDLFNEILVNNKDPYADEELLKRVEQYGIGAGLSFDDSDLDEETRNIPKTYRDGFYIASFAEKGVNGWGYPADDLGIYKTNYKFRTSVAYFGLGANPISMCTYPSAHVDGDGNLLDGNNRYILHLDSLPKVEKDGFWSFTLYDGRERYLVPNEIDRYGITDRSSFVTNADGSVDLYIQSDRPEEDKIPNWLPAPKEQFNLILRIYLPAKEVIDRTWVIPAIQKVSS